MDNRITPGSEGIPRGDMQQSYIPYPINEDYSMIIEVLDVSGGMVAGYKVWDENGDRKLFNAKLSYPGIVDTIPPDSSVELNSYVVFHRVGAYNSAGSVEPELHTENPDNYSWICFATTPPMAFVEDTGEGTGKEVSFDSNGLKFYPANAKTLVMLATDPLTCYHNSSPPFKEGRVYPAKYNGGSVNNEEFWIVFLPAKGDLEKTFEQSIGANTLSIDVDGQGNVIDFRSV